MEQKASPPKKPMSQMLENVNSKTSITCSNVPEVLFEPKVAEKHFSKFGKVQKICLLPKRQKCIVEYHQAISVERAVLNAGAYDGFMFDVTRTKPRVRTRSKREEDPEWLPDEDLQQELSAMSGLPAYRLSRQKLMELDTSPKPVKEVKKVIKRTPISTMKARAKPAIAQPASGRESPPVAVVTVPTTLTTAEAADQLNQLRSKVSLTPDDQWRTLDARDRILRSWGGAGSRVKVGGATIGTCPDMCPEKERLHRQAEHQVMTLETEVESDGKLEPAWAIKQYSRSSADQEMPMCYELRPPRVLMMTAEHLRQIADTPRQVTLADWFHFMWDRFRSIRKDITQQALCCADSIRLVEICARFHAHCGARLADLEHTQFDQKLNTDNLTKCLQTLKHMYADVEPHMKPNEAEFRGYIALLNLGDANFWWEVKQLPQEIQKSKSITFALNVFSALDNNNFVKFFRLVRDEATYLQACILLRYFNDVRARALARIVKAYAPKGGFLFPGDYIMNNLAFENVESMKAFITHYGLRFAKSTEELFIVLNRSQFIEDSDPFPLARAINLIESKRQMSVGDVICGGKLPTFNATSHNLYSSFDSNGTLKETALLAEDLGYNTINDTNSDIKQLKAQLAKLSKGTVISRVVDKANEPPKVAPKKTLFDTTPRKIPNFFIIPKDTEDEDDKPFSFQPALAVASSEDAQHINENIVGIDKGNPFTFSKPQQMEKNVFSSGNLFANTAPNSNINNQSKNSSENFNIIRKPTAENFSSSKNLFANPTPAKSIFVQATEKIETIKGESKNIFVSANKQIPPSNNEAFATKNIFSNAGSGGLFTKPYGVSDTNSNIFSKSQGDHIINNPTAIFGSFKDSSENAVTTNGNSETTAVSPGSLFKSVNQKPVFPATTKYSIFQTKNKASTVAESIFSSVKMPNSNVYDFDQKSNESYDQVGDKQTIAQEQDQKAEMERLLEMQRQQLEEKQKQEELKKKQEEQIRIEELKKLEEEKRERERKQAELKKKLEEERQAEERRIAEEKRKAEEKQKAEEKRKTEEKRIAEEKRKAEEKERLFKEWVEKESNEIINELQTSVVNETVEIMLKEEIEIKDKLFAFAEEVNNEITNELVNEICMSESKAEVYRTKKLMNKWFHIWRKHFIRNYKRRSLLEDTPIWLTDKTPQQEAQCLRRSIEKSSLNNMNAINKGYKFVGELNEIPAPKRFNLVDIIRSSFLKRMKDIQYPYDKCFFWKLTIISPGQSKWIYKKINAHDWIMNAFSDKKEHAISKSLLYVGKESWNNLMDFAISINMINKQNSSYVSEAIEGSNGILHYLIDVQDIEVLEDAINNKYSYQVIPVAVIASEEMPLSRIKEMLHMYKNRNIISDFLIFVIGSENLSETVPRITRRALRWVARNYPRPPPLEIDYLKSICQRYLGNEIWCRLKSEPRNTNNLVKLISYYNLAVSKLTEVITNEDLFNHSTFPLEFKNYLNDMSPYPKPYEFICSNVRNSDNICAINKIMERLKLPTPRVPPAPFTAMNVQEHVQKYCQQIGWFENHEEVACKVVAKLPEEASIVKMPYEEFSQNYHNYDLIDILNVIVYEKIKDLNNFDNRFAIYLKPVLEEYRHFNWLRNVEAYSIENEDFSYEDDIGFFLEAKRRKIEIESMEQLMLEDKDCTIVEENLEKVEGNIKVYTGCEDSVMQLEQMLEEEQRKSEALENLLRTALFDV